MCRLLHSFSCFLNGFGQIISLRSLIRLSSPWLHLKSFEMIRSCVFHAASRWPGVNGDSHKPAVNSTGFPPRNLQWRCDAALPSCPVSEVMLPIDFRWKNETSLSQFN